LKKKKNYKNTERRGFDSDPFGHRQHKFFSHRVLINFDHKILSIMVHVPLFLLCHFTYAGLAKALKAKPTYDVALIKGNTVLLLVYSRC